MSPYFCVCEFDACADRVVVADVHVGKHLWKHCIKVCHWQCKSPAPPVRDCVWLSPPQGVLATKTRLLVTHQLQYLSECDRVIVMSEGRILHMGTVANLTAAGVDLTGFVSQGDTSVLPMLSDTPAIVADLKPTDSAIPSPASALEPGSPAKSERVKAGLLLEQAVAVIDTAELVPTLPTTVPVTVTGSGTGAMKYVKSRTATQSELFLRGRLITNEFRVTGSVHKSTLKTYVEVWQCGDCSWCLSAR